jgi:single-strand DNA-binding protein
MGQYLSKGRPLFVEGRLKLDSWDDKETGQKRSKLKVVCENFQFLGAPKAGAEISDQSPGGEKPQRSPARGARPAAAAAAPAGETEQAPPAAEDDNIPF